MYNKGSAEFNKLINKSGGNALTTRFTFSDFSIEKFTKLEYYGGSNNSDDIAIGTTNMAYLDVNAITDKLITNQEFLFEVGMELSDGTIEYAPMGYFTVQSPDSDEDIVNFKAYDRMQKFEKPYVSSLTYPTNSSQILNELCATCGVELATPIASPITITDKLEGYTCREVLGYVAGIHGKFACFDRYGKLNLRWYSETPIEKQIGLIWALTKSQANYKVEKITLAKNTETTYTSGTGISGINHSNPYATQEIADSIYTSLGNFTYRPCEISMLDDIRLDPWDMLKVTYLDGSVLTIPVMSLEHSFTSGETKVKSFGKTDTENEYSYSGPVTQAMDRMATELLVVNRVVATKVDAEWVNAHTVTADKIEATNARVEALETNSLTVETADLRYATITNLNAQTARIEDLEATALTADSAIITNLQTGKLNTSDLNAEVAKLGYLTANSADLKYANITFGNIDTANIDVANIGLLFTKVGLIDRATIIDGHITGFLDAVEINASNITAGTLIADRILLKGSESGLLYALNNLGELTSTTVDTLDGTILTQRTVTADKLVANSITANELDVTNIFGNSAVLTTLTSQQAFINAISTNIIVVGASNTANNALNTINNLEIGGRNLIKKGELVFVNCQATLNSTEKIDVTNINTANTSGVIFGDFPAGTYTLNYGLLTESGFRIISSTSFDKNCIENSYYANILGRTGYYRKMESLPFTFTLAETTRLGIIFIGSTGIANNTVNSLKLENGNKATDWSPAPEDISVDNIYTPNTTTIDGGKITTGSIKSSSIDVDDVFAQDITAKGSITGATLKGAKAEINSGSIGGFALTEKLTATGTAYLPPTEADFNKLKNAVTSESGATLYAKNPWFDLSGDGKINITDLVKMRQLVLGKDNYSNVSHKTLSNVTIEINPDSTDKTIRIYGTNAWGSVIDTYFGAGLINTNNIHTTSILCDNGIAVGTNDVWNDEGIKTCNDIIAGLGTSNQVSLLGLKDLVNQHLVSIYEPGIADSAYKGSQVVYLRIRNFICLYAYVYSDVLTNAWTAVAGVPAPKNGSLNISPIDNANADMQINRDGVFQNVSTRGPKQTQTYCVCYYAK